MIYGDTSFLLALYHQKDAFHAVAKKLTLHLKNPIALTLLGELELLNGIHRTLAAKVTDQGEHNAILRQVSEDESDGILVRRLIDQTDLFARARELSKKCTPEISTRSLDILHVAAAQILGPDHFISFDVKQRLLVKKTKLSLLPHRMAGNK